jgi:hypothetical protein
VQQVSLSGMFWCHLLVHCVPVLVAAACCRCARSRQQPQQQLRQQQRSEQHWQHRWAGSKPKALQGGGGERLDASFTAEAAAGLLMAAKIDPPPHTHTTASGRASMTLHMPVCLE